MKDITVWRQSRKNDTGRRTKGSENPGGCTGKSSSAAAVSGPVTKEMKLITESGKPVSEGDRVRVVEE